MDLVIFTGLQAAGKSTFFQRYFAATHTYVSKDTFRSNKHPASRQQYLIEEALQAGHSVVVDNTNPTVEDRAHIIALGRLYHAVVIGYYFASSVGESRERNKQRSGKECVPDVAIYATAKRLVAPSYNEDFDQLFSVRVGTDGNFVIHTLARSQQL